jgi:hypothetical protein
MFAAIGKTDQSALRQILPAVLPGQTERLLLATITANEQSKIRAEQVKLQAETEEALVREVIPALRLTGPAGLDAFKNLQAAFNRLSDSDKAEIFPPAPPSEVRSKSGGNG